MTLKDAINLLLNKYNLGDMIYHVRARAIEEPLEDGTRWKGDSWEHPSVKEFSEIVSTLKDWSL